MYVQAFKSDFACKYSHNYADFNKGHLFSATALGVSRLGCQENVTPGQMTDKMFNMITFTHLTFPLGIIEIEF